MEIPQELKQIYNHWQKHTKAPEADSGAFLADLKTLSQIELFISERMRVWQNKAQGKQPPFTENPILQKYRFCNIYRELDRQTIEIHRDLNAITDFETWLLNVAFARYVCNSDAVKQVGLLSYDKQSIDSAYMRLKELKSPKYGTAYVFPVSTIMRSEFNTREKFFTLYLPKVIPQIAAVIQSFQEISVVEVLEKILPVLGFNHRFHWTEILIDVAYRYPQYIDLYKRFPIGPGAKPTFQKLNPNLDPEIVCKSMINYMPVNFPYLTYEGKKVYLSAENWEGIGCEFRKYSNLLKGEGRKRLYKS